MILNQAQSIRYAVKLNPESGYNTGHPTGGPKFLNVKYVKQRCAVSQHLH